MYGCGVDFNLVAITEVAWGGSGLWGVPDALLLQGGEIGEAFILPLLFQRLGPDSFPVDTVGGLHVGELFLSGGPLYL